MAQADCITTAIRELMSRGLPPRSTSPVRAAHTELVAALASNLLLWQHPLFQAGLAGQFGFYCLAGVAAFVPGRGKPLRALRLTTMFAGMNAARLASEQALVEAPPSSATGALARYVSNAATKNFQPVNITFALLEPLSEQDRRRVRRKRDRRQLQVELALKGWDAWLQELQDQPATVQAMAL